MLSTQIVQYIFEKIEEFVIYLDGFNTLSTNMSYDGHVMSFFNGASDTSPYSLWYLSTSMYNSNLLWAIFFDELFVFNSFEIEIINTVFDNFNSWADNNISYVDVPDYVYLYNSFILDWSDDDFLMIGSLIRFFRRNEEFVNIPIIFINMTVILAYLFIFASLYFSYYGKANTIDSLIDHDYLLTSSTVEAEEEISSWDDMVIALGILVFSFLWYFGTNIFITIMHLPEYHLSMYIFPVLYYVILLIPAFLAYDFGIYFVSYLRGKGDSTISVVELMYDYIAFASFYIRLAVQNVRLLLMTFTFASFHEIILIHEVNKSFLIGDESIVESWMNNNTSLLGLCVLLFLKITTHIIYYFYELLHLLFVVTAQIIAFNAMVFWLFLFLYTMFTAELHEKYFFYKRLQQKNLANEYLNFKNSYMIK